jgi:hypothetical protein
MDYQGDGLSVFGQGVCKRCGTVFDCPVDELGHQTDDYCAYCLDGDDEETDCPIHGKCEDGECPRC